MTEKGKGETQPKEMGESAPNSPSGERSSPSGNFTELFYQTGESATSSFNADDAKATARSSNENSQSGGKISKQTNNTRCEGPVIEQSGSAQNSPQDGNRNGGHLAIPTEDPSREGNRRRQEAMELAEIRLSSPKAEIKRNGKES